MIYMHEKNFSGKIKAKRTKNASKRNKIEKFYNTYYKKMRNNVDSLDFSLKESFDDFAKIINKYDEDISLFEKENHISFQEKLKSSFYEEICCYLFKNLPRIVSGEFDIFNKKVCTGLTLDVSNHVVQLTKNVDFCVGQKFKLKINGQKDLEIIKPVVAIEVKTYTDATMFGEIKNSNEGLRGCSPDASTYVLMGYNSIGKDKISAAKYIYINEMFALREKEGEPMLAEAFRDFYQTVSSVVEKYGKSQATPKVGRLLNPKR